MRVGVRGIYKVGQGMGLGRYLGRTDGHHHMFYQSVACGPSDQPIRWSQHPLIITQGTIITSKPISTCNQAALALERLAADRGDLTSNQSLSRSHP